LGCAVWRTLRFCAFWGGFNSVFSNILDLPIYPVLFAGYVGQIFPHLSSHWLTVFKFIALVFVVGFNIKGVWPLHRAASTILMVYVSQA
jgi:hypothetical protein